MIDLERNQLHMGADDIGGYVDDVRKILEQENSISQEDIDKICEIESERIAQYERIGRECRDEGYEITSAIYSIRIELIDKVFDSEINAIFDKYQAEELKIDDAGFEY